MSFNCASIGSGLSLALGWFMMNKKMVRPVTVTLMTLTGGMIGALGSM